MSFSASHHVGIIVKNLDRSIYFYHDLLGLDFDNEPSPWFEGEDLARGVGVPDARLCQVSLRSPDGLIVEQVAYANREERAAGIAQYLATRPPLESLI